MESSRIREVLTRLGYEVREREDAWAECLVMGHGERWYGRGAEPEEAFRDALAGCFPSKAAQEGLEALFGAAAADPEAAPQRTPTEAGEAESPAVEALTDDGEDPPEPDPRVEPPAPVIRFVSPEMQQLLEERRAADEEETLAELARLEERILGSLPDLAAVAAHRQRLVLLGWLAQVRHLQDSQPYSTRTNAAVTRIVRGLRQKSDCWWPGMIAAFRQNAHPAASARDLKSAPASALFSWEAVAEAAERELLEVEELDAKQGRDDRGWADVAQLSPPPKDPELLLAEVRAEVERHGGDIHGWQPKDAEPPGSGDLLRWARLVRWIRGRVDGEDWGALVGRLRFWAGGSSAAAAARELLDAGYRPGQSWASILLAIESEKREALELEQVLGIVPSAEASEEELLAWLARALPLTTRHHAVITKAALPLADRIWTIDEAQLLVSDRRIRRRLQKLKEALAEPTIEDPPSGVNGVARGSDAPRLEEAGEEEVPEVLLDETSGLRVLYVSNRSEAVLQERLQERFGFSELAWEEAGPRRVAAATEAIASGSFDMVLGATGFLGHSGDGLLRRACKAAGIPYVRVYKGKTGLVQYSLERDLLGIAGRDRA